MSSFECNMAVVNGEDGSVRCVAGMEVHGRRALFSERICSVLFVVTPIASACSLPSAMTAITESAGTSSISPPAEVRPGDMMLAPERTKRIAPRSTRYFGKMSG